MLTSCSRVEFAVNGTGIPDVDFDVGESYAGSIPVTTDEAGDYLFFWFFPSTNPDADKEILIWLNGGVRIPIFANLFILPRNILTLYIFSLAVRLLRASFKKMGHSSGNTEHSSP